MSIFTRITSFASRATFSLAALAAWGTSAAFNVKFATTLSEDPYTMGIYVVAALSLDVVKGLAAMRLTQRNTPLTIKAVSAVLVVIATTISLLSALSMRSDAKQAHEDSRKTALEARQDAKELIRTSNAALASLPVSRLPTAINMDMKNLEGQSPWTSSEGCTNATVSKSKTLCHSHDLLKVELDASIRRAELIHIIRDTRMDMKTLPVPKSVASPVAVSLVSYMQTAGMTDTPTPEAVMEFLILLITVSLEAAAVLTPMIITSTPTKSDRVLPRSKDVSQVQPLVAANDSKTDTSTQLLNHIRMNNGSITTSQRLIADHLNVSQSTIARAVKELTKAGHIVAQRPAKGRGTQLVAVG